MSMEFFKKGEKLNISEYKGSLIHYYMLTAYSRLTIMSIAIWSNVS